MIGLMMSKNKPEHSKEPWKSILHQDEDIKDCKWWLIESENGEVPVTEIYGRSGRSEWESLGVDKDKANAQRIVQCVNALEGIPNPEDWMKSQETRSLKVDFYLDNIMSDLKDGYFKHEIDDELIERLEFLSEQLILLQNYFPHQPSKEK